MDTDDTGMWGQSPSYKLHLPSSSPALLTRGTDAPYFPGAWLCKAWEAAGSPSSRRGPGFRPRPPLLISADHWQGLTSTLHWGWSLHGFSIQHVKGWGLHRLYGGHPKKGAQTSPPPLPQSSLQAACSHLPLGSSQPVAPARVSVQLGSQRLDEACLIFHPDYLTSASLLTNSHY